MTPVVEATFTIRGVGTGVVDQAGHRALLRRTRDQVHDGVRLGQVGHDLGHGGPVAARPLRDLAQSSLVATRQDQIVSVLGQGEGHGAPQAPARSGHYREWPAPLHTHPFRRSYYL